MTPEQELIATLDEYVLLLRTLRVPNIIERSKILREKIDALRAKCTPAAEPAALTFTDAAGNTYPLEVGRRYLILQKKPETKMVYMGTTFKAIDVPSKPFVFMLSEITPDGKLFRGKGTTDMPDTFIEIEHFFRLMKSCVVLTELSPLTADEMKILSLLKLGIDAREAVK